VRQASGCLARSRDVHEDVNPPHIWAVFPSSRTGQLLCTLCHSSLHPGHVQDLLHLTYRGDGREYGQHNVLALIKTSTNARALPRTSDITHKKIKSVVKIQRLCH
jgi:hypothetical protein